LDIVSVQPEGSSLIVKEGGHASARANDGSKITLTGSGTFGRSFSVRGGGNWTLGDAKGVEQAKGSYRVTELLSWSPAPGSAPAAIVDRIGDKEDAGAGLAVLAIRYSDGERGTLVVSCMLEGTSHSVFEGVTATKGFTAFWEREAPSDEPFVDANRTVFHAKS
jgi:hypothetical protein